MIYALKLDLDAGETEKHEAILQKLKLFPGVIHLGDGKAILIQGQENFELIKTLSKDFDIPHFYVLEPTGGAYLYHMAEEGSEYLGIWTDDVHEVLYETQGGDFIGLGDSAYIILD